MARTLKLEVPTGCGFIFIRKSGVTWSNQAGGYACRHPEVEGTLYPTGPSGGGLSTALEDIAAASKGMGAGEPATSGECERIRLALASFGYVVEVEPRKDSIEGWVFVKMNVPMSMMSEMETGPKMRAVLFWENSD